MDRTIKGIIVLIVASCFFPSPLASASSGSQGWYAGTCDSNIYLDREHPRTVAIRMELLDKDTHLPLKGVDVSLEGEYWEAWTSQNIIDAQHNPTANLLVEPEKREPQRKEFRLEAVSDSRGIVVFSLGWQKEYPWDTKTGDKWTYSVHDEWIIFVDSIEKVERLEIRHPKYKYVEVPLDFKRIVDLKQYIDTPEDDRGKVQKFEELWKNEIKREGVKLFVLKFEKEFSDLKKTESKEPQFYQRIANKDYGMVFSDIDNVFNREGEIRCGPYFVYDLGEILLEPRALEIELTGSNQSSIEPTEKQETAASPAQITSEPVADWLLMMDEIPKGFNIAEPSIIERVKKTDFQAPKGLNIKSVDLAIYQAEENVELFLFRASFYSKSDLEKYIETSKGETKKTIDLGPGAHGMSYIRCFTNNNDVASSVTLEIGGRSYVQDVDRCIEKYRKRLGFVDVMKWAMESQEADNDETSKFVAVAQKDPFGIAVTDLKKERAISLGLPPAVAANFAGSEGLIIEYVIPDSPAYQAGLRKDCIITIVYYPDGYQQHLFDEEDYQKALQLIKQKNAQEVKLKYWQFPQSFNGEIDYNKHLKETNIQLKPQSENSKAIKSQPKEGLETSKIELSESKPGYTPQEETNFEKSCAERDTNKNTIIPATNNVATLVCIDGDSQEMLEAIAGLKELYAGRADIISFKLPNDSSQRNELLRKYDVKNPPVQIFYNSDGEEVRRHESWHPVLTRKQIMNQFFKMGIQPNVFVISNSISEEIHGNHNSSKKFKILENVINGERQELDSTSSVLTITPRDGIPQVIIIPEGQKVTGKNIWCRYIRLTGEKRNGPGYRIEGDVYIVFDDDFVKSYPEIRVKWCPDTSSDPDGMALSEIDIWYHGERQVFYNPTDQAGIFVDKIVFQSPMPLGHVGTFVPDIVLYSKDSKTNITFKWADNQ